MSPSLRKVLIGNTAQVFCISDRNTLWRCQTDPREGTTVCYIVESLATKQMSPERLKVMNVAVKTVNYIKKNELNSRWFTALCKRLAVDHLQLSDVRWLQRGCA